APTAALEPWSMRTPEGQIYGPVAREQLDGWVREGRVTDDCQLRQGDAGAWQNASAVYPKLASPRSKATPSSSFSANYGAPASSYGSPYASPSTNPYGSPVAVATTRHQQPHRGAMILIFAILGWTFCIGFSIAAWVMGADDMKRMRSGLMDPSGMGLTQAGMILGMIATILQGLAIVFFFGIMVLGAVLDSL
ncbi:MAG: hypothetical protein KDA41_13045, partial [Planctomycetales bacterium]|nr:hypothetical protein [Planctomycetales bacterium]